jgi:multidrug resistance protein, MATE family
VAQWAVMLNAVMDTVMAGKLLPTDLAAVGIGSSIYISVNVGLMGVLMALMPEIARHHGAKRSDLIAQDFRQGLILALVLCVPGVMLLQSQGLWQSFGHPGPDVNAKLQDYLFWITLALPANLLIRCCYCLNMGIERPKVMMLINLCSLAAKFPLNFLLMYGVGAWDGLGAAGCAAATAILSWIALLLHGGVLYFDRTYQSLNLFRGSWRPAPSRLVQLLGLGIPTAGGYLLEVTSFTFMALWLSTLGPAVSASHQIAANFTSLIYMIGQSIASASTSLTAKTLGAGQHREAAKFVRHGLTLSATTALMVSTLVALFSAQIARFYSDSPELIAQASLILLFVAAYHFFDIGQTVCAFLLRAYRIVQMPMLIFFVCLWCIGLGLGYLLTFGDTASTVTQLLGHESAVLAYLRSPLRLFQSSALGFWSAAVLGVACAHLALLKVLTRAMDSAH